ncbi:PDC sensor domain-containing protein [Bacillus gobiensis]|uniref:PDC sensor domain-containing protein n=1 Tax=Bacillus gobiensis TaxID=1441095 RepID=UPI003D1A1EEC
MSQNAAAKLELVVETVQLTLDFVNQTVHEMGLQHKEVGYLQSIGKGLHETSNSLAAAIQGMNVENRGITNDIQNLDTLKKLLAKISSHHELQTLDPRLHHEILTSYFNETAEIEAIWSNKTDGTFIFSKPEAGLINAKQRECWKQAMDGAVYVSDPYISAITKASCVTLSQAIKNSDGETIGVIGMDLHTKIERQ